MASLNLVREITIRTKTEGVEKATAEMRKLGVAGDGVIVTVDKMSKAQVSAAGGFERYAKGIDPAYAGLKKLEAAQLAFNRAQAQGIISSETHAKYTALARAKYLPQAAPAAANDNSSSGPSALGLASIGRMGLGGAGRLAGGALAVGGLAGAGQAFGMAAMTVAVAGAGDQWTKYSNQLKAAGEASGSVGQRLSGLTDIAVRSRSDLGATVELYSGLRKSTEDLGKTQGEVQRVTETIAKAFSLSGQSAGTTSGAILQLNQAFASGVLRGDELNSVLEGAPPIARLIAKEFGIGVGELRSFAEQGRLTADRVFEAISRGSKEVDASFGQTTTTMADASRSTGTALLELGANMDGLLGISQAMAAGFDRATAAIRGMAGGVAAFGDQREVLKIQSSLASIGHLEQQQKFFDGKNDYASRLDRADVTAKLDSERKNYEKLVSSRITSQVGAVPEIRLNSEGMLTTERAARTLGKAIDDLAISEKTAARDGMSAVERATAVAREKFDERAKIEAKMRVDGVESAKINEFRSRSEALLAKEIRNANDAVAKKGSAAGEDAVKRAMVTAEGRTRAIAEETRLLGLSGGELDAARLRIELETAAKKRGIEVSDDLRASIEREVAARRTAVELNRATKLGNELGFERDQLGRSSAEQAIYSKMRSAQVDPVSAAGQSLADQMRLNESLRITKDLGGDALKGFVSDLRAGATGAEAMANSLTRMSDRLLDMAMDQAISGLFKGLTGGMGGGLFGGLLGGAGGLTPGSGGLYANGGAFGYGRAIPFARGGAFTNSIVSQPTVFPFANGIGLMGEAGPEGILPLRRNSAGQLGVMAGGGAAPAAAAAPNIVINEAPGTTAQVSHGSDGSITIDVIMKAVDAHIARGAMTGRGVTGKAMRAVAGRANLLG